MLQPQLSEPRWGYRGSVREVDHMEAWRAQREAQRQMSADDRIRQNDRLARLRHEASTRRNDSRDD